MHKSLKTYVGICDFLSSDPVREMTKCLAGTDLQLMVGTMTSYKVLNGLQTKWADVFPKPEQFEKIFKEHGDHIVNTIHYADYDNNPELFNTLVKIVNYCNGKLDAIQLDMVWPNPRVLSKFKDYFSWYPIILQVSSKAMNVCGDNPIAVAEKIAAEYEDVISHVLLDCSMGRGIAINIPLIEGYIEALKSKTHVQIAIAGGLGPGSVFQVKDLIQKYRVSIDAQGKLRKSGNAMDPIDWDLAKQYLVDAVSCYQS